MKPTLGQLFVRAAYFLRGLWCANAGLMLAQRLRRCPSMKPTLSQLSVFDWTVELMPGGYFTGPVVRHLFLLLPRLIFQHLLFHLLPPDVGVRGGPEDHHVGPDPPHPRLAL